MSEVVHADIFFFVTTVAVVLITIVLVVAGYYCIGILRDVAAVSAKIRKASDDLEQDFDALRAQVKTEGMKLRGIVDLLIGFVTYRFGGSRKKKKPVQSSAEVEL